ncbi:hypothetical protein [Lacinutrix chionoecetis]
MKPFFSIEIIHDYDNGLAQHLSITPANSSAPLIRNNRLLFRKQLGSIACYIEEDKAIINDIESIGFWVICDNEAFYNYTEYGQDVNFYKPHYYWFNTEMEEISSSTISEQKDDLKISEEQLHQAPKNAIGYININLSDVKDDTIFKIRFLTKATIWEYNIKLRPEHKEWDYSIIDEEGSWQFKAVSKDDEFIKFQSDTAIAYSKKASKRLKLIWTTKEESRFQEAQSMILPFANYTYKMVTEDSKELTPVYIYI